MFKPGQILTFGANRMAVAEPEFAFRMGSQFEPRTKPYSQAEVMDAVETLHTAIEVPDSRFANFAQVGEAVLIADNACAHEFVIGPPMPEDWRNTDLVAHPVEISVIGGATHFGIGENVLEDPRVGFELVGQRAPSKWYYPRERHDRHHRDLCNAYPDPSRR